MHRNAPRHHHRTGITIPAAFRSQRRSNLHAAGDAVGQKDFRIFTVDNLAKRDLPDIVERAATISNGLFSTYLVRGKKKEDPVTGLTPTALL
jgi:hypothetical protein